MNHLISISEEELFSLIQSAAEKAAEKAVRNFFEEPAPPIICREADFLYSISDLADFLKCSRVTAQHLKNKNEIPFMQVGRKLIFDKNEIINSLKGKNKFKHLRS